MDEGEDTTGTWKTRKTRRGDSRKKKSPNATNAIEWDAVGREMDRMIILPIEGLR